jgi:hypothetical protein
MKKTKLSLSRETVRALSATNLSRIVGGNSGHEATWTSCNACSTLVDNGCKPSGSLDCPTNACIASVRIC